MASNISTLLRHQIMLLKPLLHSMDVEGQRKGQDALGELGATVLRERVLYTPEKFEQFEAEWAFPRTDTLPGNILYLHGGSYSAGTLAYAKSFGGVLADLTWRPTLCIGYRLAPEHPFPAALDDATEAYRRILEKHPDKPVALVGESAGGGLVFALALRIAELGLPRPACLVALSPWTDLTCTAESYSSRANLDPSLNYDLLVQSAKGYGGEDLTNPLVSPLFGELSGLSPALILCGSYEMLLDDSTRMAAALEAAGVSCTLHVADEMWHVYPLFPIPEAKDAQERMKIFLNQYLIGNPQHE